MATGLRSQTLQRAGGPPLPVAELAPLVGLTLRRAGGCGCGRAAGRPSTTPAASLVRPGGRRGRVGPRRGGGGHGGRVEVGGAAAGGRAGLARRRARPVGRPDAQAGGRLGVRPSRGAAFDHAGPEPAEAGWAPGPVLAASGRRAATAAAST